MPSRHSQERRATAAETLARELGVHARSRPDRRGHRARDARSSTRMLGGQPPTELTRQNIQARMRGQRMWNWANSSGALFLQTGDMSEKAVGYTTIGGDLEGALSVIANVPKTVVIALLERLQARFGFRASRRRWPPSRAGAGRQAGGGERADAVPGPRRLPPPLRRREDVAGRDGRGARQPVSRDIRRRAREPGPRGSRSCSRSRSTSGCSRRSRCTSARSISIASARCRCRSSRRPSGTSR